MTTNKSLVKRDGSQKREEIKSVRSTPAKSFFVSMLTRDIELADAILDLLDNCVDGALRTRPAEVAAKDSLEGYWAHINFNETMFRIEDNCGGIPWKLARDYAFCLGRPDAADEYDVKGQIGVVGIGMKRAIFKMGRDCLVHSHHELDTFLVTIPPQWFDDDQDWDPFKAEREKPLSKETGTTIEIRQLDEATQLAFKAGSSFSVDFPAIVGETYSYLIQKGFTVLINGVQVKRKPVRLCFESAENLNNGKSLIRPYIYEAKIGNVDVFFAVGYRSPLLTEGEQEEDRDRGGFSAKEAGWTIICNDRVVLSHDQTTRTGWGVPGVPNFHNQFSCIGGLVEFKSEDIAELPITTTKRGIDTSSDLYTYIRVRMQSGLTHFTRNTNKWKGYESDLKDRFQKFYDLRQLKHFSASLPMTPLKGRGDEKHYRPDLPEKTKSKTARRISFLRELSDIEAVSYYLFDEIRKPKEVGEKCFDNTLAKATS
jgi:hypothetical protein